MATDFTKKLMQLGASGTNPNNLNPQLGALAPYLNLMESAYPQKDLLSPEEQAFLFFTKMAEESSKPGATAIGAAGSAGQEFLKTRMAQKQIDATRNKDILTGAVSLSAALNKPKSIKNLDIGAATYMSEANALAQYPKQQFGDFYKSITASNDSMVGTPVINAQGNQMGIKGTYLNDTLDKAFLFPLSTAVSSFKNTPGGIVNWVYAPTQEEARVKAKTQLIESGISEDTPGFNNIVEQIITTDKNFEGQNFVLVDTYAQYNFGVKNGKISNVSMVPAKDASDPPIVKIRDERLKLLNKAYDTAVNKSRNVLPRTDGLMASLLSGQTDTNILKKIGLPFMELSQAIFGTDSGAVLSAQNVQAMSFALAPLMRPVGSGSTSDMEFKAYQKAVLDLGNIALQNYVSLYALRQSSIINEELTGKEMELWANPKLSPAKIREMLKEDPVWAKGIFTTFPGHSEEVEAMELGSEEQKAAAALELKRWYNSLEDGSVIVNTDIFGGQWENLPYVVKGWKGKI